MKTFRQISEASVHPMAVHAYPSGKNQFTVHAIGSKVSHVSVGDKLTSSDLDDLSDAGHKVKEVKKPMNEAKMAGWKCDCGCMNSPTSMECKECETPRPMKEEIDHVEEGLGKTLAAGALALGLGAGASASMGNDKPMHYQVQKIGSDYNVYHKNNVGGKVHFSSKNKDDAMKWAMQKEEVEQGNYFDEAADLTKIDTKTLETLTQLHKHYGQKNPAAAASAKRGEEELKRRMKKEEVEQVDEISSATLVSYSQKAHNQIKGNQPADPDKLRKRTNREQGIKLAFNKHYQVRTKVPATIKEEEIDEADHVDEGKANWDKAHKQGLIDTLHNRMLQKKSMPRMGVLSKAASRELAAKAVAAGKGGKIEEAESGLSTKTLANYSNKASDASKHRTMPTGKVDNRYAGVSKVDKILAIRDKKKFD